jgi:hypothetical protein
MPFKVIQLCSYRFWGFWGYPMFFPFERYT